MICVPGQGRSGAEAKRTLDLRCLEKAGERGGVREAAS